MWWEGSSYHLIGMPPKAAPAKAAPPKPQLPPVNTGIWSADTVVTSPADGTRDATTSHTRACVSLVSSAVSVCP